MRRLTGKFIDLTVDIKPGQFEAMKKQIEADDAAREANKGKPIIVLSESDDEGQENDVEMDAIRNMKSGLSLRKVTGCADCNLALKLRIDERMHHKKNGIEAESEVNPNLLFIVAAVAPFSASEAPKRDIRV
jgi:hypothetical protein